MSKVTDIVESVLNERKSFQLKTASMDAKTASDIITKKLNEEGLKIVVTEKDLPTEDKIHVIRKTTINPKTLKDFSPVFKNIDFEIKAGYSSETSSTIKQDIVEIVLEYHWNHPSGGSNGYTVRFRNVNGKWYE